MGKIPVGVITYFVRINARKYVADPQSRNVLVGCDLSSVSLTRCFRWMSVCVRKTQSKHACASTGIRGSSWTVTVPDLGGIIARRCERIRPFCGNERYATSKFTPLSVRLCNAFHEIALRLRCLWHGSLWTTSDDPQTFFTRFTLLLVCRSARIPSLFSRMITWSSITKDSASWNLQIP